MILDSPQRITHFCFLGLAIGRGLRTALFDELVRVRVWIAKWSCAPDGLVKDTLEIALSEGRALHVFDRLDLLGYAQSLLVLNGRHLLLTKTFLCSFVVSEVELGADKDDWHTGRMVFDLGVPLRTISGCI